VTIRVASRGSTAVLTVHNHGKAIPPASLKTIFDPMVRSSEDQDHPGQSGSLGLGLLIVREVVIAHRGMVRVTSTNERGTTFRVSLPRYDKNERRPPRAATSPCRIRPHLGSLSAAS
jgi:signal transduction histidine kinase